MRIHKHLEDSKGRAMLISMDKEVKLFKDYGWEWGGDWRTIKDYQHFDKN